jgi:hypothetical protein
MNIITSEQNTIIQSMFQGSMQSTSLTQVLQFPIKELPQGKLDHLPLPHISFLLLPNQ